MRKQLHRFLLMLALLPFYADAQQSAMLSHYMFNGLLLNPAYAGSKEYVSSTLLYRKQWVGIDGAPVTYSGTIHGRVKKKNLGFGAILSQDKIGVTKQTDFYASLSYHLPLGIARLSMGMQAGVTNFSSEVVKLTYWDPGDKVYDYNTYSSLLPNAGVGIYYYRPKFYAGLSAPYIFSYDNSQALALETGGPVHHLVRRYYATCGGVLETDRDIKLKPSILIHMEHSAPVLFDLNLNVLLHDIFWVGASYRSSKAIVAIFEYQFSRRMRFGYSYDYTFGTLSSYTSGSHELMIGYDFGYDILKMKSPRYF